MMSDLWKSDANWFVTWFNTPAYHALYGERDEAEATRFIQVLVDHVLGENCHRVLDLGCGAGRHAAAFAERGKQAVGIDLSPNSIETARSLYGESDQLRFIEGDMRTLAESVKSNCFDAVASLFTSIGYFERDEDMTKTIAGVVSALRANGLFVLDFLNPAQVVQGLVEHEVKESAGYTFTIHRRVVNGWIEKSIQYEDASGSQHHVERVRALTPNDWRERLHAAGLVVEAHFGDYALNPWQERAPRSILVARKSHVVSRCHIVAHHPAWSRCV